MSKQPFKPRALTAYERKVVLDIALGLTAEESAQKLDKVPEAVKKARRYIRTVLGARNVSHTVTLAIFNGDITEADVRAKNIAPCGACGCTCRDEDVQAP